MKKWLLSLLFSTQGLAASYPIGQTPTVIVSACDMSQATCTSPSISIWSVSNLDFQAVWTGTPTGTFTVEISEDGIIWDNLPLSPTLSAAGAGGHATAELSVVAAPYVHFLYTRASGSGSLTVTAFGKVHQ